MNCLQFRRTLLEDPMSAEPNLVRHENSCRECAAFARQARADEVRLRALLRDVAPPPELAEQIQLAVRLESGKQRRGRAWLAMAASVLLLVTIAAVGFVQTGWERGHMALAQSVLHHIEDEAHHLREAGPASAARVQRVFGRFNADIVAELGPVNFAAECLMRNRTGVHLVMPGAMGPITVFFMPGERPDRVVPIESDRFSGTIEPTPWGSIAVVGEKGEPLDGLAGRLAGAVNWPGASGTLGGVILGSLVTAQQQDG